MLRRPAHGLALPGRGANMSAWTTEAFDKWYLRVYPHRNEAEASALVATLNAEAPLAGKRILDAGCGAGRHLGAFSACGAVPVGLDLSPALLEEAEHTRAACAGDWKLVQGDLRSLPFPASSFDGVVSLFTTFGYLSEGEDRLALSEAARVLRPGGFHLLDFLNADRVRAALVADGERAESGIRIRERRRLIEDARRVAKRVTIHDAEDPHGAPLADYEERVTLYAPEELCEMLREAGFRIAKQWGEYDGAPFDAAASSRCIVLAFREDAL
ncbi:MAG: SAM-dependent methyltransferase [Gemmatimonadetes bacterium]|nr:SAM-dependent methyltransferase [Gemmatimonadota bacterium]